MIQISGNKISSENFSNGVEAMAIELGHSLAKFFGITSPNSSMTDPIIKIMEICESSRLLKAIVA